MSLINVELRVDSQQLYNKASYMEQLITELKNHINTIDQIVQLTERNWKGEAGDYNRQEYYSKKASIEEIVIKLEEHPRDLIEISGVYTDSNNQTVEIAESLPSEVIV